MCECVCVCMCACVYAYVCVNVLNVCLIKLVLDNRLILLDNRHNKQ